MALTAEELQRIVDLETHVTDLQTYIVQLATKTTVRQLSSVNSNSIADLNTKIDNVEAGSESLTLADLSVFVTKDTLNQLLLVREAEIDTLQQQISTNITLRGMQDVTINEPPIDGHVLSFSESLADWENTTATAAGLALSSHSHKLETLSDISTENVGSGFILTYNSTTQQWEVSQSFITGHTISGIGTAATIVDSFPKASFRTVKYIVEVKDEINNEFSSEEILLIHDDQEVLISEFGVLFTSTNDFTTFTAEMSTTDTVELSCSCTSANNTAKITRIVMIA